MRKTILLILLFISALSCQRQLVVSKIHAENISNEPSGFSPDSSIIFLIDPYKEALVKDMSEVIAISSDEMIKKKPESELTNFISDLLLEEGVNFCGSYNFNFSPQVAFVNYGGIRSSLPKGEITVGNIFELMPFENELVILELAGVDLRTFAEKVAGYGGGGVAGMTIGIKDGRLTEFKIDGTKVSDEQSYFLVTNDYVAGGGDGMAVLSNRKRYLPTGLKIRDVIIKHLRRNYGEDRVIEVQKDGRIYNE